MINTRWDELHNWVEFDDSIELVARNSRPYISHYPVSESCNYFEIALSEPPILRAINADRF